MKKEWSRKKQQQQPICGEKVVTKEDLERYENIKKEEEIERYENILQELKKREMSRMHVFYQALHEIYDPERGGDKAKAGKLMNAYHKW